MSSDVQRWILNPEMLDYTPDFSLPFYPIVAGFGAVFLLGIGL